MTNRLVIIACFGLLLLSCASAPPSGRIPPGHTEVMTASWYGEDFHGRPTSSGERYDMYGLTAAHKKLKFGTKLRVTNPDNGRSVVVTINDRGPFIRGRDLDLSYGAAKEIGLDDKGVGRVRVEYVGRDMRYAKRMPFIPSKASAGPGGSFSIQTGSFRESRFAFRMKRGLEFSYDNVFITKAVINGHRYFRVKVGKFSSIDTAASVADRLADEGYETLIVSNKKD